MTIADKIAVLNHGELQQLGTPDQIFNEPANLFVAQFVGSPDMNVFDGTVEDRGDAYCVETAPASFDVPKRLVDGDAGAGDVVVGFRPQDLYQTRNRSGDGPVVDAEIRVVEPVGTEAIVHGGTDTGDVTAKVGNFHDLSAGDSLSLTIAPEHVYLFDARTEELIKGRLMAERTREPASNGINADD